MKLTTNEIIELDFLRYFYDAVESALGPASDDIRQGIKDDYERDNGDLPEGYGREY